MKVMVGMYIRKIWRRIYERRLTIISSVIAVCIGSMIGLLFLFFINVSSPLSTNIESSQLEVERKDIESFRFFVLQVGMFEEEENVKEMQREYPDSFIWEKDKYYLLLDFNQNKSELPSEEGYAKEINIEEKSILVTEAEGRWLEAYLQFALGNYDQELQSLDDISNDEIKQLKIELERLRSQYEGRALGFYMLLAYDELISAKG